MVSDVGDSRRTDALSFKLGNECSGISALYISKTISRGWKIIIRNIIGSLLKRTNHLTVHQIRYLIMYADNKVEAIDGLSVASMAELL